nr:FGF-3 [Pieris rapae granulovirus]
MFASVFCDDFDGSGEEELIFDNANKTKIGATVISNSVILEDENEDRDLVGETYNYYQKTIQLFQYIDGENVYLDTSNQEITQYIVNNEFPHRFLNIIQYSLEKNSEWDDDNQIVLRHEISLYYFCITNCGVMYMSSTLTLDCVFVRELVQDISYTLEKIYLKKRFGSELRTLNMEYGQINFKEYATLYSIDMDTRNNQELTPVMDEANTDICTSKYNIHFVNKITKNTNINKIVQSSVHMSILVICLTSSVLILGVLIIVMIVVRHKKVLNKTNII